MFEIEDLIEKPSKSEAPSNLAIAARYVFAPAIFDAIKRTAPGKGGEIQITDAIRLMMKDGGKAYGICLRGMSGGMTSATSRLISAPSWNLRWRMKNKGPRCENIWRHCLIIIRKYAHARAGLLGNPSDGYNGQTISVIVRNFCAEVVLYEWESLDIMASADDRARFQFHPRPGART